MFSNVANVDVARKSGFQRQSQLLVLTSVIGNKFNQLGGVNALDNVLNGQSVRGVGFGARCFLGAFFELSFGLFALAKRHQS